MNPANAHQIPLKIITLNLRYDKPDKGEYNWQVRKGAIADLISHYNPDFIGTQEGKAHQLIDLHRLLPSYQSVGRDRTGKGTDEYCAIFYRTSRFQCLETNDFSLSDTPEIPGSMSRAWGNPLPRMVTWGTFAIANTHSQIIFLNTHLDYNSSTSREMGAKLIQERFLQIAPKENYHFLTGDFNASPNSLPRQVLAKKLNDVLFGIPLKDQMTYHDFIGKGFRAIDTIYYDQRVALHQVQIDTSRWQGVFPSDHFPVIAEFEINS